MGIELPSQPLGTVLDDCGLSGFDLSGIDLTGAKFMCAVNLKEATLDNLPSAVLDGFDFDCCNLAGVDSAALT